MYYENLELSNIVGEEWRDVVGYEGLYQVSNLGRIKSMPKVLFVQNEKRKYATYVHRKAKILKQILDAYGYLIVSLYGFNNSYKNKKVHRIVAEAFLENIGDKPQIDHIDCNRRNNVVENLRYCTAKENHQNKITELKRSPIVAQLDKNGKIVATFKSPKEVARTFHIWYKPILECCKHIRDSYNGYRWVYLNEHELKTN